MINFTSQSHHVHDAEGGAGTAVSFDSLPQVSGINLYSFRSPMFCFCLRNLFILAIFLHSLL